MAGIAGRGGSFSPISPRVWYSGLLWADLNVWLAYGVGVPFLLRNAFDLLALASLRVDLHRRVSQPHRAVAADGGQQFSVERWMGRQCVAGMSLHLLADQQR